ncbi:MAG: glycosyltransferase [Candidatus Sulfobium sp.]
MANGAIKIAFVVATKDRPKDIRRMLGSLESQSCRPDQVVIVDSSSEPVNNIVQEFPSLAIKYIYHDRPSASAQRNAGIKAVSEGIDLIGFLDDDVVLESGAMEAMTKFWQDASADVGGCGFNLRNFVPTGATLLKHLSIVQEIGLYSKRKGVVMKSGWQTMIGTVERTTYVQWLPSTASVWRRRILDEFRFEEYFEGYSYLEDLDFSYAVCRNYRLAVVADAGFYHYHSPSGRIGMYDFGKREVSNRLFFVRKHGLSLPRCYLALMVRLVMTIWSSLVAFNPAGFQRALGNCVAIVQNLLFGKKTSMGGIANVGK